MKKVIKLEQELLNPLVRKDKSRLQELLDPGFIEIIPSGEIWTRGQIIDALLKEVEHKFDADSFWSKKLDNNTVLIGYSLSSPGKNLQFELQFGKSLKANIE